MCLGPTKCSVNEDQEIYRKMKMKQIKRATDQIACQDPFLVAAPTSVPQQVTAGPLLLAVMSRGGPFHHKQFFSIGFLDLPLLPLPWWGGGAGPSLDNLQQFWGRAFPT